MANVSGLELKRAIRNPGSSIKIISLIVLDAIGILREKITRKPIDIRLGDKKLPLEFANLDLTAGPI